MRYYINFWKLIFFHFTIYNVHLSMQIGETHGFKRETCRWGVLEAQFYASYKRNTLNKATQKNFKKMTRGIRENAKFRWQYINQAYQRWRPYILNRIRTVPSRLPMHDHQFVSYSLHLFHLLCYLYHLLVAQISAVYVPSKLRARTSQPFLEASFF